MFKKFIKIQIFADIFLLAMLVSVNFSSAAVTGLIKNNVVTNIGNDAQTLGNAAGYEAATGDSALFLIQTVINIFLSVIGVLLLAYLLYAGYNWMTAQGEEEKVERAKDTIKRAIMGIIIIVAAYAISVFVMSRIEQGTLGSGSSYPSGTSYPSK